MRRLLSWPLLLAGAACCIVTFCARAEDEASSPPSEPKGRAYDARVQMHQAPIGFNVPKTTIEDTVLPGMAPPAMDSVVDDITPHVPPPPARRTSPEKKKRSKNWILPPTAEDLKKKDQDQDEASGWGWLADEVQDRERNKEAAREEEVEGDWSPVGHRQEDENGPITKYEPVKTTSLFDDSGTAPDETRTMDEEEEEDAEEVAGPTDLKTRDAESLLGQKKEKTAQQQRAATGWDRPQPWATAAKPEDENENVLHVTASLLSTPGATLDKSSAQHEETLPPGAPTLAPLAPKLIAPEPAAAPSTAPTPPSPFSSTPLNTLGAGDAARFAGPATPTAPGLDTSPFAGSQFAQPFDSGFSSAFTPPTTPSQPTTPPRPSGQIQTLEDQWQKTKNPWK